MQFSYGTITNMQMLCQFSQVCLLARAAREHHPQNPRAGKSAKERYSSRIMKTVSPSYSAVSRPTIPHSRQPGKIAKARVPSRPRTGDSLARQKLAPGGRRPEDSARNSPALFAKN